MQRRKSFIFRNLFFLLGIFFTQLILCTWPYGEHDMVSLLLSNCVGRCGLFLFVIWLGDYIWLNRGRIQKIKVTFFQIYVIGFVLHCLKAFMARDYYFSMKQLVHVLGVFLRGTPGNIWVIYGAFLFCMLLFCEKKYVNSIVGLMDKKDIRPVNINVLGKWGGTAYSIVALLLFVYANIYMYAYSFDHGMIIYAFRKVLGTNRPAVILAIPFMIFGFKAHIYRIKKWILAVVFTMCFVVWCIEVVYINMYLHIYNVFMTIVGAFCCLSLYLLMREIIIPENKEASDAKLFLYLFAFQYPFHEIITYGLDINTKQKALVWLVAYSIITLIVIRVYCVMRLDKCEINAKEYEVELMRILNKIITVFKTVSFKFKNVDIPINLHSNISKQTEIKNSGSARFGVLKTRRNVAFEITEGELSVGDYVYFNNNCLVSCRDKIVIGEKSTFGPNVCIYDHDHKFGINGKIPGYSTKEVIIGKNVWVGANCIILKGTIIGDNSIIGAGTLVKGHIAPNSIAMQDKTLIVSELKNYGSISSSSTMSD